MSEWIPFTWNLPLWMHSDEKTDQTTGLNLDKTLPFQFKFLWVCRRAINKTWSPYRDYSVYQQMLSHTPMCESHQSHLTETNVPSHTWMYWNWFVQRLLYWNLFKGRSERSHPAHASWLGGIGRWGPAVWGLLPTPPGHALDPVGLFIEQRHRKCSIINGGMSERRIWRTL